VVEAFLEDSRFQYIRFDYNRGLGAVMKDLLGRVRTPFWANPGGDDRLHPEFLKRRLAAAAEVDNPIIVHGTPRQIDSEGRNIQHFPVFDLPRHLNSGDFLRVLLYHNVVINPGVMVSTAHTEQCLKYMRADLNYAPDWYWWILHSSLEGKIVFDDTPCMDYRYHESSLSGSSSKAMLRAEEVRSAPLFALHDASKYSASATEMLREFGPRMEALWARRTLRLAFRRGHFKRALGVPWLSPVPPLAILRLGVLFARSMRLRTVGGEAGFVPSGVMERCPSALSVRV
jgi:hypothetical protein